ncbi:MAG: TonB-dependent receptor [Candidatus Omnitrophica bacterium]|nr:TonB-dependent receptor [Candidatus Omnitrophota bacterium]
MKSKWLLVTLSGVVLFSGITVFAQQQEDEYSLGKIVVTPSRYSLSVSDSSLAVSVITKKDIEATTSHSATDLLSGLPGVFVHKTTGFGRADVVIRGHGSRGRRIMVLVDGKPEKMGLYGCTITDAFPLDNVQRIEVVRGPASVLYGSDALGGVLNIITEKPTKEFQGELKTLYGSYDLWEVLLKQGGKYDRFDYFVTFDTLKTRGHLPNSDFNRKNLTLRLAQQLNDELKLIFNSRAYDGFKREPAPSPAYSWNNYERGSYDLSLEGEIGENLSILGKLYRDFGTHRFSDKTHSKDYTNGVIMHYGVKLIETNQLLIGGEFRQQGGKVLNGPGVTLGKYEKDEYGFFLQDEQRFLDRLILTAGVRYNEDEYAGSLIATQTGAVLRVLDTTSLRAVVNRGFRAPQLNELRFATQANPDLKEETVWNYEVGINHIFNEKISLETTYFIMHARDFIRISAGKFQNLDKVRFRGHESSLNYAFNKHWQGRVSYSWLHTGRFTQGRPKHEVDVSILNSVGRWRNSVMAQIVDEYYAADNKQQAIPNFFLLNLKTVYNVKEGWEVFGAVNNVLNVEHKIYADIPGASGVFVQPKRNYEIGLTFKW